MAVAIQAQLKPLGYDIQVQQVQDIIAQIKDSNFDAALYSVNSAVTGDPQYLLQSLLTTTAPFNYGRYTHPEVDALVEQLRRETDPAKRGAISRQAQELAGRDVPNLYLVAAPVVSAYKKGKVRDFTLHPNDLYWINREISVG